MCASHHIEGCTYQQKGASMFTLHKKSITYCIAILSISASLLGMIHKEGSEENNPWVYDVPQAFSYIPVRTHTFLGTWTNDVIHYPLYTQRMTQRFEGIWGDLNHFNSIKRMPAYLDMGTIVIAAGTDPHAQEAQLFIAHLPSENNNGAFRKNMIKNKPPLTDKLIKKIALSSTYWHAGSIDSCGSYIAIPIYNNKDSRIVLYKMKYKDSQHSIENLEINNLNIDINRPELESKAVAMTRTAEGNFVIAVWGYDRTSQKYGFDFYFSKDHDINNGFDEINHIFIPTELCMNYQGKHTFQNINFVNDYNGKLYLVGLENTVGTDPLRNNKDSISLFEVTIRKVTHNMKHDAQSYNPDGITASCPVGSKRPYIRYITEKHMFCKQGMCNFSSGATLYIPDQQHLVIYSLPQWLKNNGTHMVFAQFASTEKTYPK